MTKKIIKEQIDGKTVYKTEDGEEIKTYALDFEDLININIGEAIALLRHSTDNDLEPSIVETLCLRLLREGATHLVDAYYFLRKHTSDARIVCHGNYYDRNRTKSSFIDVVFEPLEDAEAAPGKEATNDRSK